jgi:dienelactone hydrolase
MTSRILGTAGLCILTALCWTTRPSAQAAAAAGATVVTIRGERQEMQYLPARGARLNRTVLFVPGDGGWEGWAITVAETIASWGYDVYGVDTKAYLVGFSRTGTLTEAQVTGDMCTLGAATIKASGNRVTFVGWSEGAGLGVLAAAGADSRKTFNGLITFGLSDENVIRWHWSENLTSLLKKPHEPTFSAASYIAKVAPLPLMMIQSSHDQYVGLDEAKRLFTAAQDPKRFDLVEGDNHRFDGNHDGFFLKLREGLDWTNQAR